ncbi:MAG TPA: hypothetical protein VFN26_07245 [Candidatus Acidoferrum sp.]|nr:hypothetical protein [Candidatus Acidoferrum sp.]
MSLLDHHSTDYVGQKFPTKKKGRATNFALLRISGAEASKNWRPGFYRFDADIMRIDEALQACAQDVSRNICDQKEW